MLIEDIIYFSPNFKIKDMNFNCANHLRGAFHDRITNYYLYPAIQLNHYENAFASGVLLLSMIDALSRYIIEDNNKVGNRFKEFLRYYIINNESIIDIIYDKFRNGLIHEARIKNCCMFSYDYKPDLFFKIDSILIINPYVLSQELEKILHRIDQELKENKVLESQFIERLKEDFEKDVKILNKIN